MDYNSSRVFALTLAHRAIGDVRRDGFRQLRNYVDMCAILAKGPMQQSFFERAQNMLEKTDSLYYNLIRRLIETVDEDRICSVGINVGLGGLVYGAGRLKQRAAETGQPGCWLTVAQSDDPQLDDAVDRAEKESSFLWVINMKNGVDSHIFLLAKKHPQCVFFLLLNPLEVNAVSSAALASCNTLVPLLVLEKPELSEAAHAAAEFLRRDRLFFGALVQLDDETAPQALAPEWLDVLAQKMLFCVYSRHENMSAQVSHTLWSRICENRTSNGAPLLLLDWEKDTRVLSEHISPLARVGSRVPAGESVPLTLE